MTPNRQKTQALLSLGGTGWQNAKAMLKVDVGGPTAPTAQQLAEAFVKDAGGNVSPDVFDFDGVPGVMATTSTDLTAPRNLIVLLRGGKAYLLMAGASEGAELGDALAQIRSSWKWK